jgi:hypothetical protein
MPDQAIRESRRAAGWPMGKAALGKRVAVARPAVPFYG